MVKQIEAAKTSSCKLRWLPHVRSEYRFPSWIVPHCYLPASIKTTVGLETSTGEPGYVISGSLCKEDDLGRWLAAGKPDSGYVPPQFTFAREDEWPEPPHIAFANLRADGPQSAEAFIKRYGLLSDLSRYEKYPQYDAGFRTEFSIEGSHLLIMQDELQRAWQGEPHLIGEMEDRVEEYFAVNVVLEMGHVELQPKDLWTLICFLFLRDYTAGKLGICENPDCPAPYFKKKRTTQRFCEQGPCVQYAQRQYSLNWWNTKGKKKREERQKRRRIEKRSTKRSKR